ncbi:MFS transporter [Arthrobacter nitrophenolicus]|uniref:ACS family tartrate transporter-like MFS transporter n=2 Tax=Arthrobacter nitrophenolicus TaxID=683150 RepID=A0ACC6TKK1_9MICC|nr:MFS transporter [Arthrobacter nitrophenolicus]ELT43047.1 tartrate transporter [Arthrobacter nitrophenolicus]
MPNLINTKISAVEKVTMRKVSWRILPLALTLYVVSSLDRISLGYAQLDMGTELGIDPAAFGFAAGIFFAGYILLEMPSNAIMYRIGARIWLARIAITWGLVTIASGFVQNETQLIVSRILLGVAEAGLAPGVIFYFASFFPAAYKARSAAIFLLGSSLAGIIGGTLSGLILDSSDWFGLSSWRWIFILFGIPAFLLGLLLYIAISDSPSQAKWLSEGEKAWLVNRLTMERDAVSGSVGHTGGFRQTLTDPKVLMLSLIQFFLACGFFGIAFWLPQIIRGLAEGSSNTIVGFLSAVPYVIGGTSLIVVGRLSDRKKERIWHTVIPLTLGGAIFVVVPLVSGSLVVSMLLLCVAAAGLYGSTGGFWAIIQQQFSGYRAALSIAAVNSLGMTGGLVAPYVFGLLTKYTGSTNAGITYLGIGILTAALILVLTRKRWVDAAQAVTESNSEGSILPAATRPTR